MRLSPEEHHKHAWRVATLAPDFELLDVWRYPIELDESVSLEQFIDFMQSSQRDLIESRGAAGALFRLRGVLGKLFGWDDDKAASASALPIPGCSETWVRTSVGRRAGYRSRKSPAQVERWSRAQLHTGVPPSRRDAARNFEQDRSRAHASRARIRFVDSLVAANGRLCEGPGRARPTLHESHQPLPPLHRLSDHNAQRQAGLAELRGSASVPLNRAANDPKDIQRRYHFGQLNRGQP